MSYVLEKGYHLFSWYDFINSKEENLSLWVVLYGAKSVYQQDVLVYYFGKSFYN